MRKLEDTQSYKLSFKGKTYTSDWMFISSSGTSASAPVTSARNRSHSRQTPGHYAPILTGSSLKRPTTRHTSVASAASPPTANC